ncbi:hypothetical protein KPSA3_02057 [Pseudomonas syringae pv. actinidiae]|uniref:Uncharacterized protein n=1 Tax=Pseudomonas syringae pv. actinidiae TaxID=103796 RepID=A0AAN4Q3J6_PSESF|nr:hypothetical protein KPSA3_02057 [Pseudomonas syringae pv. actinidiae]
MMFPLNVSEMSADNDPGCGVEPAEDFSGWPFTGGVGCTESCTIRVLLIE